ncbi:MAG: helix-turn-helix transcriptional regulator [Halioglobus sp.]|nr:helix-turn-helix transcriptional regulator [Halioglobus sp.]
MAQVTALVESLKSTLKAHGIRYADVGRALGLSESSVKRRFSQHEFTIAELDAICGLAGIEISDLVNAMERRRGQLQRLSVEQEKEIASDTGLLLVTVCVLNHWTFDQIRTFYTFSEHELIQQLALLDRLQLIDLQPGNRIRLRVATNFGWLPGGPIESVFLKVIQKDFFAARFDKQDHQLIVLNGMLSDASNAELRRKLQQLAHEFDLLNQGDSHLPFDERHGNTLLLAVRDWHYQGFAQFWRD